MRWMLTLILALFFATVVQADTDGDLIHKFKLECVWQEDLFWIPHVPIPYRGYICMNGSLLFVPEYGHPRPRPKQRRRLPYDPNKSLEL